MFVYYYDLRLYLLEVILNHVSHVNSIYGVKCDSLWVQSDFGHVKSFNYNKITSLYHSNY